MNSRDAYTRSAQIRFSTYQNQGNKMKSRLALASFYLTTRQQKHSVKLNTGRDSMQPLLSNAQMKQVSCILIPIPFHDSFLLSSLGN